MSDKSRVLASDVEALETPCISEHYAVRLCIRQQIYMIKRG